MGLKLTSYFIEPKSPLCGPSLFQAGSGGLFAQQALQPPGVEMLLGSQEPCFLRLLPRPKWVWELYLGIQ